MGPQNIQGEYNFISHETGDRNDGRVMASLPITNTVIAHVEELGLNQGQPFRASKNGNQDNPLVKTILQ